MKDRMKIFVLALAISLNIALPAAASYIIKDLGVTTAKIAASAVTAAKVETSINLPGAGVKADSKFLVQANTNAATAFSIVRGIVNLDGSIIAGEGFTDVVSSPFVGFTKHVITFTTPFASVPAVTAIPYYSGDTQVPYLVSKITAISTSSVTLWTQAITDTAAAMSFIAIGPR